ncbi:MAG: hypothetical protein HY981_00300 [Candidatus Magasanikbacteria bacterium]|nr:hypothetical protein [Candidatus Magasanikbacteria bacterium]
MEIAVKMAFGDSPTLPLDEAFAQLTLLALGDHLRVAAQYGYTMESRVHKVTLHLQTNF